MHNFEMRDKEDKTRNEFDNSSCFSLKGQGLTYKRT